MIIPAITSLYAALLALLFIALSVRVILTRRRERVSVGDGDNPRLCRAIGVHNNFAQYVPFALLLMALVELTPAPILLVHILGILLLVGRLVHAWGVSRANENYTLRMIGITLTLLVIGLAALYLLRVALVRMLIHV
jgi:uncharacterized membrane protein YecN with MAPEG domain